MSLHRHKRWGVVVLGLVVSLTVVTGWGVRELLQPRPNIRFTVPVLQGQGKQSIQVEMFQPVPDSIRKHPAILMLHGVEGPNNFWRERYQTASHLCQQGYCVFIVNYMNGMPYEDLYLFDEQWKLDLERITQQREQDDERWVRTVQQVLNELAKRPDVDAERIALYGNSMGGFLALAVAAEQAATQAENQPACLVVNWGALWPETEIPQNYPPTLFVHGERDEIVEPKWAHYSVNKIREAKGQAELMLIPGAGHIAQSPEGDQAIRSHLAKHLQ